MTDKPPRYASWTHGKLPLPELAEMKRRGEKIVMVTAYDAPSGRLADEAGVDMILVGDSSGMVVHGRESTVAVTMDEIVLMTQWVTRGAKRPIVVGDMPFGSYEASDEEAVRNAVRLVKEGGADVVKLERGGTSIARARAIVDAGVGVMGHVGLTPQTSTLLGGFKAQGRSVEQARRVYDEALALSLFTLWPVRIAVYGQDLFRTGGDDYGRGDAIFGAFAVGFLAWSVLLLLLGVRAVHGWSWPRSAATVALTALPPGLVVLAHFL